MLVSVYMPTRNRLALLQRAVQSVMAQTWDDVELIVVNDASDDGTAAWLDRAAANNPRLRVHHQLQRQGAPAARNLALRMARGEWVTGLDDDDLFTPDRIALFVRAAQAFEECGRPFSCFYASETRASDIEGGALKRRGYTSFADLFEANWIGSQIFVRRETLLEIGGYDESLPAWQDLELYLRLLSAKGSAVLVDAATYLFDDTDRPDRISKQKKERLLQAWAAVSARHAAGRPDRAQQLLLQIYQPGYDWRLGPSDLRRYFRFGFSQRALAGVVRTLIHQVRKRPAPPTVASRSVSGSTVAAASVRA